MSRLKKFRNDVEAHYNIPVSDIFTKFANKDMSYHDVAIELGYSETTIRAWSNKIGIKLKSCYSKKNSEPIIPKQIKDALSQNWIKTISNYK